MIPSWLKWAIWGVQMLVKWGPGLWDLGKKIYHEWESRKSQHPEEPDKVVKLSGDTKGEGWLEDMSRAVVTGRVQKISIEEMKELREDVWKSQNRARVGNTPWRGTPIR